MLMLLLVGLIEKRSTSPGSYRNRKLEIFTAPTKGEVARTSSFTGAYSK